MVGVGISWCAQVQLSKAGGFPECDGSVVTPFQTSLYAFAARGSKIPQIARGTAASRRGPVPIQLAAMAVAWVLSAAPTFAQPITSRSDPARALPPEPGGRSAPLKLPVPSASGPGTDVAARFVLRQVEFNGATALSALVLEPTWIGFRDKPVSLADLRAIRDRVEALYAAKGYPFVAVVTRPQPVRDGVVHFTVVEGRISDLTVLSADPAARRQATAALATIVDVAPLPLARVDEAYQLAREVPGLAIAGALRRGSRPGGMDLLVDARRQAWRTYLNINNLYAGPVGRWGVLLGADYNGTSRFGDQTSAQIFAAPGGEQKSARLVYLRRLDPQGLALSVGLLVSHADPQGVYAPLELATRAADLRLEISQPFVRRAAYGLTGFVALEGSDQQTRVFRTIALTQDKSRVASLGLRGAWTSSAGRISAALELRQGVQAAGSSRASDPGLSRVEADPKATVGRLTLEGETATRGGWSLGGRVEAQAATASLLASEEYGVGALSIGRGFDPGAALGDQAVAASVELRAPSIRLRPGLMGQPFVFADAARLWNYEPGSVNGRTLGAFGAGLRLSLTNGARLDLTYAQAANAPLGQGEKKPPGRLQVNFTTSLDQILTVVRQDLGARL